MAEVGLLVSVNVGTPRWVEWHGRQVRTAIWKEPVSGRVGLRDVNLEGDDQADRRVHGGPDKAVYAYALEDYRWWAAQLAAEPRPGTFGENLTTMGVDLTGAAIGDRWHVSDTVLEVAQPRMPCFKLGIRMGDAAFVRRFSDARRPGVYLRIIRAGNVTAGDEIAIIPAAPPAVRVADLVRDDVTAQQLAEIAADVRVPQPWRSQAARALR
ncbi:MAG: MOSC domain-containing protein [Acidimicrobiia bacterium]